MRCVFLINNFFFFFFVVEKNEIFQLYVLELKYSLPSLPLRKIFSWAMYIIIWIIINRWKFGKNDYMSGVQLFLVILDSNRTYQFDQLLQSQSIKQESITFILINCIRQWDTNFKYWFTIHNAYFKCILFTVYWFIYFIEFWFKVFNQDQ